MNDYALTLKAQLLSAFNERETTTQAMQDAIALWYGLYYDRPITVDCDPSQRIAYTIVNKLTKTTFSEFSSSSDDEWEAAMLDALDDVRQTLMQQVQVGGEAFLKPYPTATGIRFNVIRRDAALIFGRDAGGVPTDIGTIEQVDEGRYTYSLLERRTVGQDGLLTITNRLYRSDNRVSLGSPVPLSSLARYAMLEPSYTYSVPMGTGLVYVRMPIENTVDGSVDGVSVYAAAVGLIHDIDHNEALINLEFDNGRSRVFVHDDLTERDERTGRRTFDGSLFHTIDGDPDEHAPMIFSPQLREMSFLNRKLEYLRNVESIIGLKRGLLSQVEAVERTATEITSSEGDYALTIADMQGIWTKAVEDSMALGSLIGVLYNVPGAHINPDPHYVLDYGNGVLYDKAKEISDALALVQFGLLKPEYVLAIKYGLPTETDEDMAAIREKYMPDLQALTDGAGE
jgi:A118 family predicted phage portal protein